MTKHENEEYLKNATLKIETNYSVGSGFFISQDLVATCYHVIEGCSSNNLKLTWQGKSYKAVSIELNPDDDLALISVKINKKHPCLKIDKRIKLGDRCYSFGFPYNYRNIGDTLTFEYEGSNESFLKFKDGQFESGFSGAPILNLATNKVCGIIKKTRDEQTSLGGRGIPISKIFSFGTLEINNAGSIFSKEMFKNWVWKSSLQSVNRSQLSILALFETFLSVGVALYIWFYYGFYGHIIIGLIVSPLFFLRTKKSERDVIAVFFRVFRKSKNSKKNIFVKLILAITSPILVYIYLISMGFSYNNDEAIFIVIFFIIYGFIPYLIMFLMLYSIISLYAKIIITIRNIFLIEVLFTIPKNWFKIVLSTDSFHPIEIAPSINKSKYKDKILRNNVFKFDFIFISNYADYFESIKKEYNDVRPIKLDKKRLSKSRIFSSFYYLVYFVFLIC